MELTPFQKIMLAVTAGMFVFFSVLMIIFRVNPGVLFEDSLLKTTKYEYQTIYTGKAHNTPVTISVLRDPRKASLTTVDFTIGAEIHDVFEVEYPLGQLRTESGRSVDGIRVTKNGEVLFEGGYEPEGIFGWFTFTGEYDPSVSFHMRPYSPDDHWYGYETTAAEAVNFALGPGTAAHGQLDVFGFAVFLSILLVLDIFFHKESFRWKHRWAKDPEPTEEALSFMRVGWVLFAAVIGIAYIVSLAMIY